MQAPSDPTAVLPRRLLAFALDTFIISVLFAMLLLTSADRFDVPAGMGSEDACDQFTGDRSDAQCLVIDGEAWVVDGGLRASHVWIPTVVLLANHVVLAGLTGFSVGKAATGLRIVGRDDGARPGLTGAAGRTLPWLVSAVIPAAGLMVMVIEFGLIVTTPGRRRFGDRIAGTLVVDRRAAGSPPLLPSDLGGP